MRGKTVQFSDYPILVRGAGEHASSVAWHLSRSGFPVAMTERHEPLVVRRLVAFAAAARKGECEVEGVRARLCGERLHPYEHGERGDAPSPKPDASTASMVKEAWGKGEIALVIDDGVELLDHLPFHAILDARMCKESDDTIYGKATLTLALGPGFRAGEDVDLVIETERGHDLGRIIDKGQARHDTGVPGDILGFSKERVHHAPCTGRFWARVIIGDLVHKGDMLGFFEGDCEKPCTVVTKIPGRVRGLIADGEVIPEGTKVADVDPRGEDIDPATLSDKGRTIASGVLTAILSSLP
ncbi:MAG: NADP-binding protein [Candidatus Krumholzibacteria bacterium]|jgi:xanthine dehydrogenase accessory factor|nr:NADP-binding protein [Candidatus Krumholzibacteria bacterium]